MKKNLSLIAYVLGLILVVSSCNKDNNSTSTSCTATNALNAGSTNSKCNYSQVVFYIMKDTLNNLPLLPLKIEIDNVTKPIGTIYTLALNQPNNCSSDLPDSVYATFPITDSLTHNWTVLSPNSDNTISGTFQASATQSCIMIKIN